MYRYQLSRRAALPTGLHRAVLNPSAKITRRGVSAKRILREEILVPALRRQDYVNYLSPTTTTRLLTSWGIK